METEKFLYLISKQAEWAEAYKRQEAFKHKERVIRMSKYRSRGKKMDEQIEERLNNLHRSYFSQPC